MDDHALQVLEFEKILDRAAGFATFEPGRELVRALRPSVDLADIRERHAHVAEMTRLERMGVELPLGGLADVRPLLTAVAKGQIPEPRDLLALEELLRAAMRVRGTLERLAAHAPRLAARASEVGDFRDLVRTIERAITRRGDVADAASEALALARRQLRAAQERLDALARASLNDAVRRGIAQEPLITERNGRKVLPIKAEFRGQFPGIVHDVSASGATVFVEPVALVEAGNAVRELEVAVAREERRVLQRLGGAVASRVEEIRGTVDVLARLDAYRALARFGASIAAGLPGESDRGDWLQPSGKVVLRRARHPLLRGEVVPIDLDVGGEVPGLLITGPNTGGKTVALKTLGLLTLMAQAGIPVPCEPGSRFVVFRQIYADIGDEQSIEQSLSTFSSHLRHIISILRRAGPGTLALLDELGAGTDPTEGAALARAVLEALLEQGAVVVATTHHAELKLFGHADPRLRNASVEFDLETLTPTYRLTIGLPGQSNAIAIAERLGLGREILERARALLTAEHAELERLLADVRAARDAAEAARVAAEREREEAARIRLELARERAELERERAQILEAARSEAAAELAEVQREVAKLRRRLTRREFDPGAAEEALRRLDERVRRLERRAPAAVVEARELAPGDLVFLQGIPQPGRALTAIDQEGRLEVQFGSARMRVTADRIERVEPAPGTGPVRMPDVHRRDVPTEIDLRGQRAEEAIARTETFLDDAFRAGLPFVRIIHGKGTGALRAAIREALARHPLVRRLETPDARDGGEGVTIAVLAG